MLPGGLGPIFCRNLERHNSASVFFIDLLDLVQLHELRWIESAERSCIEFASLARIGCIFEHVAHRHLLSSGSAHA